MPISSHDSLFDAVAHHVAPPHLGLDHAPRAPKRRRRRWSRDPAALARTPDERTAADVAFCRSLGVDVIVTADGRAVLVELQHGFGRRGLIRLFPAASRAYRRQYSLLKRERRAPAWIVNGFCSFCGDKTATYRLLGHYQAPSFVFREVDDRISAWVARVASPFVLVKPPRGSCGRGIEVLARDRVLAWARENGGRGPLLLQEFVESRHLPDQDGQPHLGCIRHIVILDVDRLELTLHHLPSYWRVASTPLVHSTLTSSREALTANISTGAYPLPVAEEDEARVQALVGDVCRELAAAILGVAPDHLRLAQKLCLGESPPTGTTPFPALPQPRTMIYHAISER